MNNCILSGRLVSDPEMKKTNSGTSVCAFTLAVWKPTQNGGSGADFLECVAWEKNAERIAQKAVKGDTLIIRAEANSRTYETRDGAKRKVVEFKVINFEHFAKPAPTEPTAFALPDNPFEPRDDDPDLPF